MSQRLRPPRRREHRHIHLLSVRSCPRRFSSPAAPASSAVASCGRLIAEEPATRVVTLDKLTYAGNLDSLQPVHGRVRDTSSSTATSPTWPARAGVAARPSSPTAIDPSCRRVARRSFDRRARCVRADQRRRHVHAARSGPRSLDVASRRRAGGVSLPARLDRRGLRLARRRRARSPRRRPTRRARRTRRRRRRRTTSCAPTSTPTACRR